MSMQDEFFRKAQKAESPVQSAAIVCRQCYNSYSSDNDACVYCGDTQSDETEVPVAVTIPVVAPVRVAAPLAVSVPKVATPVIATPSPNGQERIVFQGSPSAVCNLSVYIICTLFCWLIIPIFYAIWRHLELKSTQYQITDQRIRRKFGFFSTRTDEIELYRVRDTRLDEPFFLRMFGLGSILVMSSDRLTPAIYLYAVAGAGEVRERIRFAVEHAREAKGVRIIEN